jgi:hypothetical protein
MVRDRKRGNSHTSDSYSSHTVREKNGRGKTYLFGWIGVLKYILETVLTKHDSSLDW